MATPTAGSAAVRSTEGVKDTGAVSRGKGGRPAGSKNKPKGLLPPELAEQILLTMQDQLPPEHFEYMRSVIRDGKAISTSKELDALILLLSRNLYPALIAETFKTVSDEEEDPDGTKVKVPEFRKDVTERLKVLNGLLNLRHQIDKRADDDNGEQKPLLKIWADRGISGRLAVLIGDQPGGVAGDADRVGRGADPARTVSDQVPERPLELPSGK